VSDDIQRWVEQALRDRGQVDANTVNRIVEISRDPNDWEAAIAELSDGDLVFCFDVVHTPGTRLAEGVQSGIIQTDRPNGQILITTEQLAWFQTLRDLVAEEIAHRIDNTTEGGTR
jgi:hypothetical protein